MPLLHLPFTYRARVSSPRSRTVREAVVVDRLPVDVPEFSGSQVDGREDIVSGSFSLSIPYVGGRPFVPTGEPDHGTGTKPSVASCLDDLEAAACQMYRGDDREGPVDLSHPLRHRLQRLVEKASDVRIVESIDRDERALLATRQASGLAIVDGELLSSDFLPLVGADVHPSGNVDAMGFDVLEPSRKIASERFMPHFLPETFEDLAANGVEVRNFSRKTTGSASAHRRDRPDVALWIASSLASSARMVVRYLSEDPMGAGRVVAPADELLLADCLRAPHVRPVSLDAVVELATRYVRFAESDFVGNRLTVFASENRSSLQVTLPPVLAMVRAGRLLEDTHREDADLAALEGMRA